MFNSLFLTKNQKLVKKWTKEHEKIVFLVNQVIAEYSKNNHKKAKKNLVILNHLVVDHVTDENIEFYKLSRDTTRLSTQNIVDVKEFIQTFTNLKKDLMKFLTKYTRKDTALDDDFFETISSISEVLLERIEYEEAKLYSTLNISREEQKWENIKRDL